MNSRGFTLLEIVVYMGILAVIVVLAVGSFLQMYQAFLKIRVERRLTSNGEFTLERLVRSIRASSDVDGIVSVFGSSPGTLKVGTNKFYVLGGVLKLDDGSTIQDLSTDVSVASLKFYDSASGDVGSHLIKIEMTLQAGSGKFLESKNFFAGAVIRGGVLK